MYRWPDEVLPANQTHFRILDTPFDGTTRNLGHTVQNWGRPITLQHTATGLVARVWFYRDLPRTMANPAAREVWPRWQQIDVAPRSIDDARVIAGTVTDDQNRITRVVAGNESLLIRLEFDGPFREAGQTAAIDLLGLARTGN